MKLGTLSAAVAASALTLAPVAAQAGTKADAQSVRLSGASLGTMNSARASAPVKKKNGVGPEVIIPAVVAVGAVGVGIAVAVDDEGDDDTAGS
jgi:hypothetical protein